MAQKILQVNFKVAVTPAEYEAGFGPYAPTLAEIPGLRWKIWLVNGAQSEGGGIYLFDDEASLQAFLEGPIVAGVKSHPALSEVSLKAFDVLEGPTAITRGPVLASVRQ